MEDAGQGEVLAVLGGRGRDGLALSGLSERVLLLRWWALVSLRVWLGWGHLKRAEHWDLDCLWMVNDGRSLLVVWRWSRGINILGVVSTVELMEHVALLGRGEGILALLRVVVILRRGRLEVQEQSGRGEHRPERRAEHLLNVCCLQTTDALHDVELDIDDDDDDDKEKGKEKTTNEI